MSAAEELATDVRDLTAAERFAWALRIFRAMSDDDIVALLARSEYEHNQLSWTVLGIIALEQGDIDVRRLVLR